MKRLGDLPFDFRRGTCGTFMINDAPTILLCFPNAEEKRCRSLIRKNDLALNNINNFEFYDEFALDTIEIPDTKYDHEDTKIANYQGFPLILGGGRNHAKLEIMVTLEFLSEWKERSDYPYGSS